MMLSSVPPTAHAVCSPEAATGGFYLVYYVVHQGGHDHSTYQGKPWSSSVGPLQHVTQGQCPSPSLCTVGEAGSIRQPLGAAAHDD